jgi:hypothetical protein
MHREWCDLWVVFKTTPCPLTRLHQYHCSASWAIMVLHAISTVALVLAVAAAQLPAVLCSTSSSTSSSSSARFVHERATEWTPCSVVDCVPGGCRYLGCSQHVECRGGGCYFETCTKPACRGGGCTFASCSDPGCNGGGCSFLESRTLLAAGFCVGGGCDIDGFAAESDAHERLAGAHGMPGGGGGELGFVIAAQACHCRAFTALAFNEFAPLSAE